MQNVFNTNKGTNLEYKKHANIYIYMQHVEHEIINQTEIFYIIGGTNYVKLRLKKFFKDLYSCGQYLVEYIEFKGNIINLLKWGTLSYCQANYLKLIKSVIVFVVVNYLSFCSFSIFEHNIKT